MMHTLYVWRLAKTHLGTKQHQTVKKSNLYPYSLLNYAWLEASLSQSGSVGTVTF